VCVCVCVCVSVCVCVCVSYLSQLGETLPMVLGTPAGSVKIIPVSETVLCNVLLM